MKYASFLPHYRTLSDCERCCCLVCCGSWTNKIVADVGDNTDTVKSDFANQDKLRERGWTLITTGDWSVSVPRTLLAAEVRQSHVLQRDLLQEAGPLAAGVARHDLPAPQPITEPGQPAVTVEGVGQEVPGRERGRVFERTEM